MARCPGLLFLPEYLMQLRVMAQDVVELNDSKAFARLIDSCESVRLGSGDRQLLGNAVFHQVDPAAVKHPHKPKPHIVIGGSQLEKESLADSLWRKAVGRV